MSAVGILIKVHIARDRIETIALEVPVTPSDWSGHYGFHHPLTAVCRHAYVVASVERPKPKYTSSTTTTYLPTYYYYYYYYFTTILLPTTATLLLHYCSTTTTTTLPSFRLYNPIRIVSRYRSCDNTSTECTSRYSM